MQRGAILQNVRATSDQKRRSFALCPPSNFGLLAGILAVAIALRLYQIDRASLWYDEVVTMRVARTTNATAALQLLGQIDATRAPLHPLLLQTWLKLVGVSDFSGRGFSVICGIIVIGLTYWVSNQAFDRRTAIFSTSLCAVSPLLVYYSREIRMYMWLVLATCLAWALLLSSRYKNNYIYLLFYDLVLVAVVYSHPLGLLMLSALALASLIFRQTFQLSFFHWLLHYGIVIVAILPWIPHYTDHPPELVTGVLPIRYLLGMPIGFIGGNSVVLALYVLLIGYGLVALGRQTPSKNLLNNDNLVGAWSLLIWLVIPSSLLYLYSLVIHPIFGPARYTLFVAPAYLILVGHGLARLPQKVGLCALAASVCVSGAMLINEVYRPDLKADWKGLAAYLDKREPNSPLLVMTVKQSDPTQLETARYYLGSDRVKPWSIQQLALRPPLGSYWLSIPMAADQNVPAVSVSFLKDYTIREGMDFSRLRLLKLDRHSEAIPSHR